MGILVRPWTVQPQVAVGVDGNYSNKLEFLFHAPFNELIGAGGKVVDAIAGNTPTQGGLFAATGIVRHYAIGNLNPTVSVSVMAVVVLDASSGANERIFLAQEPSTPPYQGYGLFRNNTGKIAFGAGNSGSIITEATEGTGQTGGHTYIGTFDGANVILYRDGVQVASVARSSAISYTANSVPFLGGYYPGSPNTTQYLRGKTGLVAVWGNRALSPAEARTLSANPWQLFAPLSRRLWVPVSAGGSPALTGVSATGAVGALSPQISIPLTGVNGTGAVGTLTAVIGTTAALTGVSGTGAVGTLQPQITVPLSGVNGAGAVGTLTPSSAVTAALAGVSGTGAVGTIAPQLSIPLAGVSAVGALGAMAVAGGNITIALSGVSATSALGTFGVTLDARRPKRHLQQIRDERVIAPHVAAASSARGLVARVTNLPAEPPPVEVIALSPVAPVAPAPTPDIVHARVVVTALVAVAKARALAAKGGATTTLPQLGATGRVREVTAGAGAHVQVPQLRGTISINEPDDVYSSANQSADAETVVAAILMAILDNKLT